MSIVTDSTAPADIDVGALYAAAREAGDRAFIHYSACPTRKRGGDCLRCQHLDMADAAAERRLASALGVN